MSVVLVQRRRGLLQGRGIVHGVKRHGRDDVRVRPGGHGRASAEGIPDRDQALRVELALIRARRRVLRDHPVEAPDSCRPR